MDIITKTVRVRTKDLAFKVPVAEAAEFQVKGLGSARNQYVTVSHMSGRKRPIFL